MCPRRACRAGYSPLSAAACQTGGAVAAVRRFVRPCALRAVGRSCRQSSEKGHGRRDRKPCCRLCPQPVLPRLPGRAGPGAGGRSGGGPGRAGARVRLVVRRLRDDAAAGQLGAGPDRAAPDRGGAAGRPRRRRGGAVRAGRWAGCGRGGDGADRGRVFGDADGAHLPFRPAVAACRLRGADGPGDRHRHARQPCRGAAPVAAGRGARLAGGDVADGGRHGGGRAGG